jgi:hypothetical protein
MPSITHSDLNRSRLGAPITYDRVRKPTNTLGSDRLFGASTRLPNAFVRCGILLVGGASTLHEPIAQNHTVSTRRCQASNILTKSEPQDVTRFVATVCLPQQHLYGLTYANNCRVPTGDSANVPTRTMGCFVYQLL